MVNGFVQLVIKATKKDVFVGGVDVLDVGLLEDCFSAARCPSVCLIRQTVPKGRRTLDGSRLNMGFIRLHLILS